jgi:hypothetical protein
VGKRFKWRQKYGRTLSVEPRPLDLEEFLSISVNLQNGLKFYFMYLEHLLLTEVAIPNVDGCILTLQRRTLDPEGFLSISGNLQKD